MSNFVDCYELLELKPTATADEIKKALNKAKKLYHPDRHPNATKEEEEFYNAKMTKINYANEQLTKPDNRRAYDELWRDQQNPERRKKHEPPEQPGGDYDKENRRDEPPLHKAKYIPGATAHPYTAPGEPRIFFFPGDGLPGAHGEHGRDGNDGNRYGEDGTNGRNATAAENGQPGKDYNIRLDTVQGNRGHLEVSVLASTGTEISNRQRPEYTPLKLLQSVDFSSQGGKGGDGGRGGNGGNGARGYAGENATRHRNGTNGGPGGDGGNGGLGTHGGHGGRGGNVKYLLDVEDTYLLMKVGGVDPVDGPGSRVDGGGGGAKGAHGRGGSGGRGGPGGSSFSYSVPYQRRDSDGRWYTDYQTHTNPGGWGGRGGSRGVTPKAPLALGSVGNEGSVSIHVKNPDDSSVQVYRKRYDLAFMSSDQNKLSDMKGESVFEFGETVHIKSLKLKNSGFMPTPKQRVIFAFDECNGIVPEKLSKILIERGQSVNPGTTVEATEGFLIFSCPYPVGDDQARDFEPIQKVGWRKYSATQLGPEIKKAPLSHLSDFKVPYTRIHAETPKDTLHMAFPIENQDGIRGVRALAANETTFIMLRITNRSNQSFGFHSSTKRSLYVLFQYVQDDRYEIPIEDICVRSSDGKIVRVDPGQRSNRGYRAKIPFIEAGANYLVQVSFKLDTDPEMIRTGARAGLQAQLFLDDIPQLSQDGSVSEIGPKRMIQSRLFEASCQPKFNPKREYDVVLVATVESEANQIAEWERLVTQLGQTPQVYSLSRYGHFLPHEEMEDVPMKEAFKNKLVVFLNDEYRPRPNDTQGRHEKKRPSELFSSPYEFDESTKFLMVGGKLSSVEQLTPNSRTLAVCKTDPIESPNRKRFKEVLDQEIRAERQTGFVDSPRAKPKAFEIQIKVSSPFGEPNQRKSEKILKSRCQSMQKWINKNDNMRHDTVTWDAERPVKIKDGTIGSIWSIGTLKVTLGTPSYQKSIVWVSEEDGGRAKLSSPEAIGSRSMMHALLSAMPLQAQVTRFSTALRTLAQNGPDAEAQKLMEVSRDCLINNFLCDIADYYHGHFKVKEKQNRSPCITALSKSEDLGALIDESLASEDVKSVVSEELGTLIAALQCSATSLDLKPWWNPLSRKHSVCKAMKEAVDELEETWSGLFDDDDGTIVLQKQKELRLEAKSHIKSRKKHWIRARGRYRAALEHLHSPTNVAKYPATAGFGPTSTRIRDEHTMTTGKSRKRKKCLTQYLAPHEKDEALESVTKHLDFSNSVLESTREDDDGLRHNGVITEAY